MTDPVPVQVRGGPFALPWWGKTSDDIRLPAKTHKGRFLTLRSKPMLGIKVSGL